MINSCTLITNNPERNTVTPKQEERVRNKIGKIKRALAADKKYWGGKDKCVGLTNDYQCLIFIYSV